MVKNMSRVSRKQYLSRHVGDATDESAIESESDNYTDPEVGSDDNINENKDNRENENENNTVTEDVFYE